MDAADEPSRRARAARFATMPIVLAGTIAITAGLTGPIAHADTRHRPDDDTNHRDVDNEKDTDTVLGGTVFRPTLASASKTVATTVAAVTPAPATYTVHQGDTVSSIADRYGLAARDILSRNGLDWNTIIHPGQKLLLSSSTTASTRQNTTTTASASASSSYHVVQGDTVSSIAAAHSVSTSAVLSTNDLSSSSVIYPGQSLSIPKNGAAATGPATAHTATATATATSGHATSSGSTTVKTGDTIASIAASHGVTVSALLAANSLTYTSTIYAGATLVLPATGTTLTNEQRTNAATIVAVGRSFGVPDRGLVIALAAAMQESGLHNLNNGDRDSVGIFQQRPSQGWGDAAQLMNTAHAARLFFGGSQNPNPGKTRGLLDIPGWASMTVSQAAQAVQLSAYPEAYGQWEASAKAWLATL